MVQALDGQDPTAPTPNENLDSVEDRILRALDTLERSTKARPVWDFLIKATVPIVFLVGSVIIKHEVQLARIEANRFTDSDGQNLERRTREYVDSQIRGDLIAIGKELALIRERLARLETLVSKGKPIPD